MSGSVEEHVKRTLFEMNQVRNVLVHKRGIADRRLVEACPWLNLSLGDSVKVDHKMFQRYDEAVQKYVLTIMDRVSERFGLR